MRFLITVVLIGQCLIGCNEVPLTDMFPPAATEQVGGQASVEEQSATVNPKFPVQHPETGEDLTNSSFAKRMMLEMSEDFTFSIISVNGVAVWTQIYFSEFPLTAESLAGYTYPYDEMTQEEDDMYYAWGFYRSIGNLYFAGDHIDRPFKVKGSKNPSKIGVNERVEDTLITLPFGDSYDWLSERWNYIYITCHIDPADSLTFDAAVTNSSGNIIAQKTYESPHYLRETTLFFEVVVDTE